MKKEDEKNAIEYIKKNDNACEYVCDLLGIGELFVFAFIMWTVSDLITSIVASDWIDVAFNGVFLIVGLISFVCGILLIKKLKK